MTPARRCLGVPVVALLTAAAAAHEYWLQPRRLAPAGARVDFRAFVGEGMTAELRRPLVASKLASALLRGPLGDSDLLPPAAPAGAASQPAEPEVASAAPTAPGSYLFAVESAPSFLEQEPAKFEAYLREDGLESILETRRALGSPPQKVRERYRRCAKTAFAVERVGGDASTRATDLALDLIPGLDPASARVGTALPIEVRFRGALLPKVLVRLWMRDAPPTECGETAKASKLLFSGRTDGAGRIAVPIPAEGDALIACVHMVEGEERGFDVESWWGSLTFVVGPSIPDATPASRPASRPAR